MHWCECSTRLLQTANRLPVGRRDALIARLDRVRVKRQPRTLGYGVGDDMDSILAKVYEA